MDMKKTSALVEKLRAAGYNVSFAIVMHDAADEKKVKKSDTPAPDKKKSSGTGTGRGRPRSKESEQREKYIRALHDKRGSKLTRVQAAELVQKKFECTIDSARSSVYAIKDLEWKAPPQRAAAAKKSTETAKKKKAAKRQEVEEEFIDNLDDDDSDDDVVEDDDDDSDDDVVEDDDDDSEVIDLDEFDLDD